jgi:hypothetical protein
MHSLAAWENFYVILGSSAAALTGLVFVVITLTSRANTSGEGVAIFSTPTVVYFCVALFIAAALSAPWDSLTTPAMLIAIVGVLGLIYAIAVMRRTRRLTTYQPDLEDQVWYVAMPLVVYLAVVIGAVLLLAAERAGLYTIAATALGLIFMGIRNAWDVVTYVAIIDPRSDEEPNQDT